MDAGFEIRLAMIITGVFLLGITMLSLSRRKMTDPFALTWALISVILILGGAFLRPAELNRYISGMGMLMAASIGFCLLFGAYFMSLRVSELMRRNQELSMQISLLRQTVEDLEEQWENASVGDEEGGARNEEAAVCH